MASGLPIPSNTLLFITPGNDGDTDENNGKYFKNNVVGASAHYFVDDDSITQSVPDNYIAWHCGATKYKHAYCRNANSIGVELCDDVKNGVVYPSDQTIKNALDLVEHLMQKYSIPKDNVIRHYDVSGKLCPVYWCGTKDKDTEWKTAFLSRLGASSVTKKTVEEIAREVIQGKWGNGSERKKKLAAAGYDYTEVQRLVNKILGK